MDRKITQFYKNIIDKIGKVRDLRAVCEMTFLYITDIFHTKNIELIITYKKEWQCLAETTGREFSYHFPPKPIIEPAHSPKISTIDNSEPFIAFSENTQQLWIPLSRQSHIVGCLVLDFHIETNVNPEQFKLLGTLLASELDAGLLRQSIKDEHNSRSTAELELKNSQDEKDSMLNQLQAMHDISFKLWRCKSTEEMLFIAVDEGKKQLAIDRIAIFLFDDNMNMIGTYGTDIHGNTINESHMQLEIPSQWFATNILENKEYLTIQEELPLLYGSEQVGLGWNACIALWDEDTPIGWIACDNLLTGRALQDYHHQLLKQFGFIVSQHLARIFAEDNLKDLNHELEQRVLSRTKMLNIANQKLTKISQLDPLTNIANRRVFDKTVRYEWRRARRHKLPISLLIMDIDYFKFYNDNFGHAAGDRCLKIITEALSQMERRAGALFARYGGDEFALLLPGQDSLAATYAANTLLETLRELAIPCPLDKENKEQSIVSLSIGVSTIIPSTNNKFDDFFQLADQALYQAKAKGRDCYCIL